MPALQPELVVALHWVKVELMTGSFPGGGGPAASLVSCIQRQKTQKVTKKTKMKKRDRKKQIRDLKQT